MSSKNADQNQSTPKQPWRLWQQIDSAPCNDTYAKVIWSDGMETIEDLDHDSDPSWWAERGATWWRPLSPMEEELRTLGVSVL